MSEETTTSVTNTTNAQPTETETEQKMWPLHKMK